MKVIELLKSKEWSGKVIDCVLRFALSFALAGAQVFGGYAPLALGMIGASGAGLRGVSALIGASAGAVLFLPFSHALRTFAAGVLIFTANNAFFDLKLYKKRAFLPLLCAGMMFSVEFVYVLRDGVGEAANCLMALLLCALGAMSGRALLSTGDKEKEDHPYAPLFILLGVLMAASSFETADGFAPGRILSMLAVLLFAFERGSAFAIPAALCIGLGMDLGAGGGSFVHAASYAFSAVLVNVTARGNRVASALWFALSILCFALPMNAHAGLVLLYEGLAATLLFLLIPSRFLRGKRLCSDEAAQEDAAVRRKIAASAAALRELYDSIARPRTLTEENPAAIFDRAAEKVCRSCALCSYCWEKEYQRTYTALNDATAALLRRGQGRGEDFPSYFSERCIHFSSFLSAVNGELRAYLLRRQYRRLLEDDRAKAASQYAQLSELMQSAADGALRPVSTQPVHSYEIGLSLRPKRGERVSGDSAAHFETEDGTLCLLLSDGMGCGE
ncbi:MAG TPA: stage II sporulation protein E, partial [Oscillibacter sp.]|nr:stage II sporulation protein E [Oscillibacter sp.]